jgi:peptide/nickel transport system substrate-binding protein
MSKFELTNRNVDQPYKFVGTWLIGEWKKIGVSVEQKVVPTGPWFQAMRTGTFDVVLEANCQSVVNPVLDTGKYLPQKAYPENFGGYDDAKSIELYDKMLYETDPKLQREAMRAYEKHTLDTMVHAIVAPYWYRIVPYQSYVKGWKISPSHYLNQDLANIWLDR